MLNCDFITPQMLLNLHKKSWMEGLTLQDYSEHCKLNETIVKEMLELAKNYNKVQIYLIHKNKKTLKYLTGYISPVKILQIKKSKKGLLDY